MTKQFLLTSNLSSSSTGDDRHSLHIDLARIQHPFAYSRRHARDGLYHLPRALSRPRHGAWQDSLLVEMLAHIFLLLTFLPLRVLLRPKPLASPPLTRENTNPPASSFCGLFEAQLRRGVTIILTRIQALVAIFTLLLSEIPVLEIFLPFLFI